MKRYHPVHLADLPPIACCCGTTRRAFVDQPDAPASAHLLEVKDEPTSHYHLKTTEIYVVLEGEGFLELDGEQVPVKPLSAVMIRRIAARVSPVTSEALLTTTTSANSICSTRRSTSERVSAASRVSPRSRRKSVLS